MGRWTIQTYETVFSAPPWVRVDRERVAVPEGPVIDDFYRVVLPPFAMVVPFTREGRVVLVRGYRHGPRRVCLSVPAGMLDVGETPLAAAQRELREETGYEAAAWEGFGQFVSDGNRECATAHLFVARGARRVAAPTPDPTERFTVAELTRDEVLGAMRTGEVATLATAAALGLALSLGV
ncbi:MAG: NUDIX hydrolase [Candidatus Rokubacteria bacterium]|nr:NUDIX hydrolase [Candidatus Rokubacteria bacterium]